MPHVKMIKILNDARAGGYAVPNLWGGTVEQVIGCITAAENRKSPLIICYNQGLCPQLPIEIGVPLIVNAAENAKVPVATILDHGQDLAQILRCIHYGISSVMFDGSSLPYDENVKLTREIVEVAHVLDVAVEAELGAVGGSVYEKGGHGIAESSMTDPEQVSDFVSRTNCDALAVSFGNVHGTYQGTPRIDLERLSQISRLVSIPLVMHGSSGLPDDLYPKIVARGISKMNHYSSTAHSVMAMLKERLNNAKGVVATHDIVSWNIEAFVNKTERLLDLLGCSGKAGTSAALEISEDFKNIVVEEIVKVVQNSLVSSY